jgi:hypothetical protein
LSYTDAKADEKKPLCIKENKDTSKTKVYFPTSILFGKASKA